MLIGKKVSLRALEDTDLQLLKDWRNNENFRKNFREYKELNLVDQKNWFDNYVVKNDKTIMFGIVENETGQLVGVCGLCAINWVYRNADLSLYVGKDNIYIDNERDGFAWGTLDLLFEYAFNRLNLHKIWTEIYEFDPKHQLFKEYGLSMDAVLRDNYFYDGKFMDSNIYTILEDEWRGANK